MFSLDEINQYSRQIKLINVGLKGQAKLKKARVLCIGAGGLASPLLLYLAASGVGTLGMIDNDIVDLSNLQRQVLYQRSHIGHKKIHAAQQKITALNPHVHINTYDERLSIKNAEKLISQYDIIADCTDNFSSRYLINDVCFLQDKPFASASITQFEGQCTIFLGKNSPCYRCLFPKPPANNTIPDCNDAGVLGVLPGLLGTMQATEIMKFILNIGDKLAGRLLLIDALKMQFREMQYTKNPACTICAQQQTVNLLAQPEVFFMNNEISLQEFHQRLVDKEKLFLLDVRTIEERNDYHIGGAFIPLAELPQRLDEINSELDIIVYCRSGGRSLHAVELLSKAGFKSVRSLKEGVMGVQQSNLDFDAFK